MQKHVHLVDFVKSFPTNIYLQNLASIQERTRPLKFAHLAEKIGVTFDIEPFNYGRGPGSPGAAGAAGGPGDLGAALVWAARKALADKGMQR